MRSSLGGTSCRGRDIATALVADIEVLVGQLRWIGWGVAEGAKW